MPQLSKYTTLIGAGELVGLTEGAIRAAIRRGELATEDTHDGRVRLLRVAAVHRWAERRSRRSREDRP